VANPCSGGIEKVKGKVKTIAIAIVKPGIAPAINPAVTPIAIRARVCMENTTSNAEITFSIIMEHHHKANGLKIIPSGNITPKTKVNRLHIAPTVRIEIAAWTISFLGSHPPRSDINVKTNIKPPISIPNTGSVIKNKKNILKQIIGFRQ
jgi:hypothetical protein